MDWCHLKIPLNRQKLEVGGDDVKEDILISIIIPAYNAEKTIDEAIQSVFQQTYQKWELIIINDCSSDKTEEFVKKYLDQNNKIIFLNNEKNLGVSATRNKGIAASKGEWIAFLDSDDKWNSEKLEKDSTPVMDWDMDQWWIYSAFRKQYGIDLNTVKIHFLQELHS